MTYVLHFDGGAAPTNPGPAGCGAVLLLDDKVIARWGAYIGEATNNVAEYNGLLLGLKNILNDFWEIDCLTVKGDSQLVIKQCKNEWKVHNEGLKPLHAEVQSLLKKFTNVDLIYIPRAQNSIADEIADKCIETKQGL
jgi:ribonuclease HI